MQQTTSHSRSEAIGDPPSRQQFTRHRQRWHDPLGEVRQAQQFAEMLQAYRGHGGLITGPELLALGKRRCGPDLATLARWIVHRSVVCFEWQSQTWFPMFQFRATAVAPALRLQPLLRELSGVSSAWQVSHWFVAPNPGLGGARPLSRLESDMQSVLQAARTLV